MSGSFCKEGRDGLAGGCQRRRSEEIVHEGFEETRTSGEMEQVALVRRL